MRTFTYAELHVSPLNVRTNREDAEATGALEKSIAVHGLLFPLVVHPRTGDDAPTLGACSPAVRVRCQAPDLRFAAEPPRFSGHVDEALAIDAEPDARGMIALPEGEVVATIQLANDGSAEPRFWWASRKAKGEAGKPVVEREPGSFKYAEGEALGRGDDSYAQRARQDVKVEHGLSADGLQVMRSLRRELLRAVLLVDARKGGNLGRDWFTWAQLRHLFAPGRARSAQTGSIPLESEWSLGGDAEPRDLVQSYLEESLAHQLWIDELARIQRADWMQSGDAAESLRQFVALPEDEKAIAAGVLAAWSLIRSANVPGWRVPAHDVLADLAGADDAQLRRFWTPTPAFASLFPKLKRLELVEPFVGREGGIPRDSFKSWHKLQDKPLAGGVAHVLQEAKRWVHALLTFGVRAEAPAAVETKELEPAQ